jgi:hypothetical protein
MDRIAVTKAAGSATKSKLSTYDGFPHLLASCLVSVCRYPLNHKCGEGLQ